MSNVTTKKELNKSQGEHFKLLCPTCSGKTNHEVLQSVETSGYEVLDAKHGISISWADWYQIVECQGCDTVSFVHGTYFSEWDDSFPEGSNGTQTRIYPIRSEISLAPKDFYNVPPDLRRIYLEVMDAYNGGSRILCAAGLRAIVEGICADKGVTGGAVEIPKKGGGTEQVHKTNLEGKISGLGKQNILTSEQIQTLHELRFLGNEAIHQLAAPITDELSLAIDIIQHTLEGLYEVPQRGIDLQARRTKRNK